MSLCHLCRLTNDTEYWDRTLQTYYYITVNNVLNMSTMRVADAINTDSCVPNSATGVTYNSGVLIGGLVEMYKVLCPPF